ncbi:MAG: hypothetical protein WAR97_13990 [Thiothrix eikelboomii]
MSKPYTPPFTITSSMLNQVSLISEKVGVLSVQGDWQSPQLRKTNQIKTITGTLQIEGNTLSEAQVSAILEGKRVLGSPRELAEVQGAIKAYEQLAQLAPYSNDDLCTAHHWLMGDILKQAGHFKTQAVGIHQGEKVIHIAPPANRVAGLMADLLHWLKHSDDQPLISSSVFHYPPVHGRQWAHGAFVANLVAFPLAACLPVFTVGKHHPRTPASLLSGIGSGRPRRQCQCVYRLYARGDFTNG